MTGSRRWMLAGIVAVVAAVGFLLFRPDTLLTDVEANESLDDAFSGTTSSLGESTTSLVDSPTTTEVGTTSPATEPTTTVGPVPVSTGQMFGIDHAAEGTATVYQQDDRFVLRLEDDTDIQNGPDLYVWVLPSTSYGGGSPTEYIDLGTLKGTVGGQNYELPADFDPELHRTVLIWCLRFAVPFAAAELG